MLRSLRGRFLLSHILPLLVVIPVMGIALIYIGETRILLPNLARELAAQAALVAEIARQEPGIWADTGRSRAFAARIRTDLDIDARLMLFGPDGRILASSDPVDAERSGHRTEPPALAAALKGEGSIHTARSEELHAEVVDVLTPVVRSDGSVAGVLRLSLQLTHVIDQFTRLRYLIGGVLAGGVLMGGAVGWVLARHLERPLRALTRAVGHLAAGRSWAAPSVERPAEIALLVRSFDTLVARLRTLEETRRQLLANLVHELARPLGALRSAVQALQAGANKDPALRQELLTGIDGELQRLHRLLDDLARLHDRLLGTLELQRQRVDVIGRLPAVLAPWREAAHRKGLRWESQIPSDPILVEVDPVRLAQAVGNLLSNAVKYTPPGGIVSVQAGTSDEELWIQVADTGPGIVPEQQARIFDAFYRGGSGRRFPQGMGLGLTIARDLINAHGGRLEIESAPGAGSRFTAWIPRTHAPS